MRGRGRCPVTIGRDPEITRLREAWDDALTGAPGLVLIRGEAGIGKSRLVDELVRYVRETSGSVLIGSCSPFLDGVAPYAPVRDALEPLVAGGGELPLLTDSVRELLQRTLFPDSLTTPRTEREPGSPDLGQGRTFTAIRHALLQAAEHRPLLLVLEDVHWADASTLQLLSTLDRGLRHSVSEHRFLVVLTFRSAQEGRTEEITSFLHEFRRSPLTDVLELTALDSSAAAELLTVLCGGTASADRLATLVRRADGNPFLLEELAAAGNDAIPLGVREMLDLRLHRLPAGLPDVLRAAAVLGPDVDPDLLAALVAGIDTHAAIEQAVHGEVLIPVGERYAFRHSLVQELLLSQLLPSDRRVLHARAAAALEAQLSGRADGARIAYHYIQAGDAAAALTWSVRAAAEAEHLGAMPEALGHYGRALDLLDEVESLPEGVPDRCELTYRTGFLAESLGQHARGAELLREAADLFAASGDKINHAKALVQRGYALCHVDMDAAMACCDEALALLENCPSTEENAILIGHTGAALLYTYKAVDALPRLTRAAEMAAQTGSEQAIASVDLAYGIALSTAGQVEEGLARLRIALEVLREARNPRFLLCAYALQLVLSRMNALEECVTVGLDALETVAAWGGSEHWWMFSVREEVADSAYKLGQWDLAATQANLAIELTPAGADTLPFTAIAVSLGRGELQEARELLAGVRAQRPFEPGAELRYLQLVAELAIMEGQPDMALDAFREGMRAVIGTEAEAQCGRMLLLGAWAAADRAEAVRASRRPADRAVAGAMEQELRALASAATTGPCGPQPRHFFAWNDAVRAQWSAELSRLIGADDPAMWVAAAEHWNRLSRPYFEGYCLMRAVGAAAARRMPASSTKSWFDGALAIATRLRAGWLHEQLNLLADGPHVSLPSPSRRRDHAPGSPDDFGLTEREREVLALLASGMTNAQLARRLFISTHTANVHVSRILTKLGVPNRTQAAAVAWTTGLAGQQDVTA